MQLCNCVTAWAGTKPCPQSSSDHHSPSLLVLSLSGAVLHKLIHLLYQTILQQTEHPGASRVVLCQTKAAHHIVDGKLFRQTVEGLDGLCPTWRVGSSVACLVVKILLGVTRTQPVLPHPSAIILHTSP